MVITTAQHEQSNAELSRWTDGKFCALSTGDLGTAGEDGRHSPFGLAFSNVGTHERSHDISTRLPVSPPRARRIAWADTRDMPVAVPCEERGTQHVT